MDTDEAWHGIQQRARIPVPAGAGRGRDRGPDGEAFFREKMWYGFDACLDRFMLVLNDRLKAAKGDLAEAVKLYNGSGARAEQYRDQVLAMQDWLA
jgi:hypothetical protein